MAKSLGRRLVLSRPAVVGGAQSALEGASPAVCERGWEVHHHLRRPFPLVRQFLYDRREHDRMDQAVGRYMEIRLRHLRLIRAAGDGRRDQQDNHALYTASLGVPLSLRRLTIGVLR